MESTVSNVLADDIVVEATFDHPPSVVWSALTHGAALSRWLMEADGYHAAAGTRFTLQGTPAGAWGGVIRCKVLALVPDRLLSWSWRGGSLLDTKVSWTLSNAGRGTTVRLVHSGFVMPRDDAARQTLAEGWRQALPRLGAAATAAAPGLLAGGCACGAIRYEIAGSPVGMSDCQCRDCQHRSGTGHGSYLTFASRQGVRLWGEARQWSVTGNGGTVKEHHFCPHCGCPVYLTFPAMPDVFVIHAASLDDPGRYQPQYLLYAMRGHAWDAVDPALPRHETMPPPPAG